MATIDLINGIFLVGFRYRSIIGRLRYSYSFYNGTQAYQVKKEI